MGYSDPQKQKAAQKAWYEANKHLYRDRATKRRRELMKWFWDLKASMKCERCPENHPACLEFHHPDPTQKDGNVSVILNETWNKQKVLDEISKCMVLCANCHRKEHHPSQVSVDSE